MFHWAVPWTVDEVIDTVILTVTVAIVAAVPLVYAFKANLRDPLARAVLAGTSATALAFIVTLLFTMIYHYSGWVPPGGAGHWIARGIYITVGLGKLLLLTALVSVLRHDTYHNHSLTKD